MFIKKSIKLHSVKQVLIAFFGNFGFCIFIIHPKQNLIKVWETDFLFALTLLNEAQCSVCIQIIRKKCEYLLKRNYRTSHTKLHSIMGCEDNALATQKMPDFKVLVPEHFKGLYFKAIISQNKSHKNFHTLLCICEGCLLYFGVRE